MRVPTLLVRKAAKGRFILAVLMLPPFELSYALERHRKVAPDVFMVAPRGERVLVWFCSAEGEDACYLFRLDRHGRPCTHAREQACFSHSLCAGTLLYGVLQSAAEGEGRRVVCEDVLWAKGERVERQPLNRKIGVLEEVFCRGLARPPSDRYLDIALPIWTESLELATRIAAQSPYPCRGVFGYSLRLPGLRPLELESRAPVAAPRALDRAVLVAQAASGPDAYVLSAQGPDALVPIGRASIPSLKASVMMNGLLRKIKENSNLDLLEESDSDGEFEDVSEGRHVHRERRVIMRCAYNGRHGAWEPVEPAPVGEAVSRCEDVCAARAPPRPTSSGRPRAAGGFSHPSTHAKNEESKRGAQKARGRRLRAPSAR